MPASAPTAAPPETPSQWIGQRIAVESLQQYAAETQQGADRKGGRGAWQPHVPDDQAAEVIAATEQGFERAQRFDPG
jgi:hypothetical protein